MSTPLERVIAEQQAKIDQLKARDLANIEQWQRHDKKVEDLAQAVFYLLDNATPEKSRQQVLDALRGLGYCVTCECNPCECDHD